jgi:LysR family glycine cleavage system transcriptional activator
MEISQVMDEMTSSIRRRMSLGALRAFEAAARLGSFRAAADELAVTPTAISHRIRNLEEMLGIELFRRQVRKVVMTEKGERLYPVIHRGLDAFAQAIGSLLRNDRRSITISAPVAFTARRLLPIIGELQREKPDVQLRLDASNQIVDIWSGATDIAIRYGGNTDPGLRAIELFSDRYVAACSPQLGTQDEEHMSAATLIHTEWLKPAADMPSWRRWFETAGIHRSMAATDLRFTDESQAIEAAIGGLGVALASDALIRSELDRGLLIAPLDHELPGRPYYVVSRESDDPVLRDIEEWLRRNLSEPSAT